MTIAATATPGESIDLNAMWHDPWPILKRLRDEEPVAWVPAADRYLVTRYADVTYVEQHPEIFSAEEKGSLLYRVMGHPFMRKDGEVHHDERRSVDGPLKPRAIKKHWTPIFEHNAAVLLDRLAAKPVHEADLISELCGPLAARNLAYLLGFLPGDEGHPEDYFDERLQTWSQTMMNAVGNYLDVPEIWQQADDSVALIDAEIDRTIARVRVTPDESIISASEHGEYDMPVESLRAAIKVIIGGGINEPRDAMGMAVYALLTHPEVRARVEADPALWRKVFEETIRWVAPISMYPKMVVEETELGGVALKPGDKIGLCVGSANRDDRVFADPDSFDIDREFANHHSFGAGAHFCAGAWVARASVSQILLPELFRRFPTLQLADGAEPEAGGWVFRGLLSLPVVW